MPGVPSGRGCNACRKQKKKCNAAVPSCSRCTRLGIVCVGSGEKRYRFIDQHATSTGRERPGSLAVIAPSTPPMNDLDTIVSSLCSALAVTDIGFDLSIYGPFFKDIPRRLGRNAALDASARALTIASPTLRTHQPSPEAIKCYVTALRCLQAALRDPVQAVSSETLCAVYLVMICQGWIGRREDIYPSHGEAIAHMLNVAVEQNWQDTFASDMINTLCMIATLESFVNPRIKLDPRLLDMTEVIGPGIPTPEMNNIETLKLRNLARLPELIRDNTARLVEVRRAYDVMQSDCHKMATLLLAVPVTKSAPTTRHLPASVRRLHVRQQTSYGILLTLVLTFNRILLLASDSTASNRAILVQDSAAYVDEVIALASQAAQYRPLGSSATPLSLITAWGVTDDAGRQRQLEGLILAYQSDFESTNWLDAALKIKPRIELDMT